MEIEYIIESLKKGGNNRYVAQIKHRVLGENVWQKMSANFPEEELKNELWLDKIKLIWEREKSPDISKEQERLVGKIQYFKVKE